MSDYTQRIMNYASKSLLGLIGTFDASSESNCKQILSSRYDESSAAYRYTRSVKYEERQVLTCVGPNTTKK